MIEVSESEFEDVVLKSPVPVLVDFFATWCGPCKVLAPTLVQLGNMMPNLKVVSVDIDKCPSTALAFGIMSVPTVALFRDGVVTGTKRGAVTLTVLRSWVESLTKEAA